MTRTVPTWDRSPYTRSRIREVARARGHTMSWVARQLAMPRTSVYAAADGRLPIRWSFVRAACDLFRLPEDYLFFTPPSVDNRTDGHVLDETPAEEHDAVAV